MSDKTSVPFSLSDEMRVKMPLRILLALLGIVAAGAIAWATTRGDVAATMTRVDALERDARQQREILIRIDERTAEIKRQMERASAEIYPRRP
jgi:parvulin-like peptidyl-prolyl isomerase